MAKGKRIAEGKTLVVYSTKVVPETRALLDALAKANGPEFGQRELLEEMIPLYMAANPDKAQKAQALLELLGWGEFSASIAAAPVVKEPGSDIADGIMRHFDATFDEVTNKHKPTNVKTVQYIGKKPTVHLYEPGSKNSTGCGLAGQIDPDTITEQSPDAVDCKKCRYCRKAVFA